MGTALNVIVWDVEHGSAAYVAPPGGQHIVIDLGTGSYGLSNQEFSPLKYLKDVIGVERLDAAIITHPHRDHLDDIFNLELLRPKVLLTPRHLKDSDIYAGNSEDGHHIIEKYIEVRDAYGGGPPAPEANPFLAANNEGVGIECFVPKSCGVSNLNNHSVVTVLSYGCAKMMIPGDNQPASWDELLGIPQFRQAITGTDVLVAPHHGRESGFSSALFEHINPYLTIISDDASGETSATNSYHQKSKGWKVKKHNGAIEERKCLTTRDDGMVHISFEIGSDGRTIMGVRI